MATAKETQLTGTSGDRPSLKEMVHVTEKKLLSTGQGAKEDVPKSCHLT